jgi:succinate-semialdehyde dehydrogenase/glutarate-semialdehyde dehydrogenase
MCAVNETDRVRLAALQFTLFVTFLLMTIATRNPATGEILNTFLALDNTQIDTTLQLVSTASVGWAATSIAERSASLQQSAQWLRAQQDRYARLITLEMSKSIRARTRRLRCVRGAGRRRS